jgi:hypothetical protein
MPSAATSTYRKFRGLRVILGIVSGSGYAPDLHIDTIKVKARNFH